MNFNKLVKLIVEPVLIFFGFKIQQDIKGIVEYDHHHFKITLSYDYNSSYEVDLTLLFKRSGLFYAYNELKEYFYSSKSDLSATQIKDEETLIKWLDGVSIFLKENLNHIIDDYEKVEIELEKIRKRQVNSYESERNSRLLSEGVDKYWAVKDYSGLIKFLKNYSGELEGSIKKKYEYASKMISRK
jgi:hypothetical protein